MPISVQPVPLSALDAFVAFSLFSISESSGREAREKDCGARRLDLHGVDHPGANRTDGQLRVQHEG
jgi:hypothetical protein